VDPLVALQDPASGGLYWHLQDLTASELATVTAVGLGRNLGLESVVPLRQVVSRIRYEDVRRRPYQPPNGDIHHRNETLTGLGDPSLVLQTARRRAAWTVAGRLGLSIPLGRTEPNPFDLGRRGLPHQHIQFGTGTWDPLLGLAAGRRLGTVGLALNTLVRLVLAENEHGYRAGNRYQVGFGAERRLGAGFFGTVSLDLAREEAERWSGRIEEEGNLGRTDVVASLAVSRRWAGVGGLTAVVRLPLLTRVTGAQVDYPLILSLGWTP
jgi:hypothetical protein